ncbi:TRAF-like family protein [Arabidopsis thaliana]|uniref:TRAF-like family protein n=1 Tax=Arabidopsis thaliana TaxID=3702 RepID=A0A1P8B6I5_ARATH|nr:TRAF-like family protein [Arabidopsis thaliana]ANM67208.1 TRAF-like family protein [Arabidopsis thaliana]|eukprot:NP_001329051.1 TRAF-like family protein [Arabidopsis thaliana]
MTLFSRVLLFLKKKSFSIAVSSLYFYICKSHFCLPYIYTTLKSTIFCPKKFIIMETLREEAPSSYLMKLVGFSEVKFSHQPYESADFDAAGHKWRLIFYPAGKVEEGGKDHISIYARVENVGASEMQIDVELKFFLYNHNAKKYSVFQDGTVKHYSKEKKECGFAQMLLRSKFNDPKNGYTDGDACIVGVEIFVIKPIEKVERVVFTQNPPTNKFTWKISDFSKLGDKKYHYSDEFVVGERKWRIKISPKGDKKVRALSVYVQAMEYLPNAVASTTYAKLKLQLMNQKNTNHIEKRVFHFFSREKEDGYGTSELISVEDLNDESKGYLVEDTIVLETTLLCVTETKVKLCDMCKYKFFLLNPRQHAKSHWKKKKNMHNHLLQLWCNPHNRLYVFGVVFLGLFDNVDASAEGEVYQI